MEARYNSQLRLLLAVLPEVAKESCFALHGGTAINLFIRNLPRLSVDIDLTYIPIEDRTTSITGIQTGLDSIRAKVQSAFPLFKVQHKESIGKLLISDKGVTIKIEVNLTGRGTLELPKKMTICEMVQTKFDVFCVMPIVPIGQLYGG